MKLDAIPQNFFEWTILKSGMIPTPLGHGHIAFLLSRGLLDAVDLGVIEALKDRPLKLEEIAIHCELNASALRSLMNVLASAGYVKFKDDKFQLTKLSRKWLLKDSPDSVYDLFILNSRVCWAWLDGLKDYLKTGKAIDYHDRLTAEEWQYYQKAMAAAARAQSKEIAKKTPVPKGAKEMLDIGGSHGLYSSVICKRNKMTSEILELPDAMESAAKILEKEGDSSKVTYKAGNILTDDIGEAKYDVVLISSLTHHFTQEQNKLVVSKVHKALKAGGYFVIMDFVRPETKTNADLIGMANDLFFSLTSNGGTYSIEEMKQWLLDGGFKYYKTVKFLTIPGTVQVVGRK
jgi:2-polyprenyl-3-methyl-5-hydroxy-6-metoxy-1,4-benzoquinol methylase